jgi:hypothetical protein
MGLPYRSPVSQWTEQTPTRWNVILVRFAPATRFITDIFICCLLEKLDDATQHTGNRLYRNGGIRLQVYDLAV